MQDIIHNKTILVTGGLGSIGRVLVEQLSSDGINVVVLDIKSNSQQSEGIRNTELILGDIRNKTLLHKILKSRDISGIIHLAAISRVDESEENREHCQQVNITGTHALLEAVASSGAKPWIINTSSREVYGHTDRAPVSESASCNPVNTYGKSKAVSEKIVQNYCEMYGLKGVSLRLTNVYGSPYDISERAVPKFIANCRNRLPISLYGREKVLDFIYISDAIEAYKKTMYLLESKENSGYYDVFNIATGTSHKLQYVLGLISKSLGVKPEVILETPREYEVNHYAASTSKALQALGFKASIPIEAGIPMAIETYLKRIPILSDERNYTLDKHRLSFPGVVE